MLPTPRDYKPRYCCFYSRQSNMLHGDVAKLTATSVVKSLTQIGIDIGLVSFGFRLSPHAPCFILLKSPLWAVSLSSFWASLRRLVRDTLFIPVPYYNGDPRLIGWYLETISPVFGHCPLEVAVVIVQKSSARRTPSSCGLWNQAVLGRHQQEAPPSSLLQVL